MKRNAFTLVELAIVLVIIALVTGAVLTGQSLIQAAMLRGVTTQLNSYQTAATTFLVKYSAKPGDITRATFFWGAPGSDISNCPATAGTGTETCNGDGTDTIGNGAASQYGERFMFWQHLTNANLIEGVYTGIAGAGGNQDSVPNENAPTSRVNDSIWFVDTRTDAGNTDRYYDISYQNYFMLGLDVGTTNQRPNGPIFTSEEALSIDEKIDDEKPGQGRVIAGNYDDCTTSTSHTETDGDYLLIEDGIVCNIFFRDAF